MSEYEPITDELREALDVDREFMRADGTVVAQTFCVDRGDFDRLCDAIDAVHAALEAENAELRRQLDSLMYECRPMTDENMAEHGWVRLPVLDNADENMHDGGRITDELRAWWVRKFPVMDKELHKDFTAIADRIDVEHQKAIRELNNLADGCVLLPLDADGVPIRVGDVMEWVSPYEDYKPVIRTVDGVGEQAFFAWTKDGGRYVQYEARAYRHHHGQTVEDVLREFLDEAEHFHSLEEERDAIAEYAKRLTLAGDAE